MLEIIFAAAAFVGSLIYFNKKPLESKSVWKAMGLSILIILAAIVFFCSDKQPFYEHYYCTNNYMLSLYLYTLSRNADTYT